jgi:hypothetical protein
MRRTPGQFLAIGGGAVISAVLVSIAGFKVVEASTTTTQHDFATYSMPIRHIEVDSDSTSVYIYGESTNTVSINRAVSEALGQPSPQMNRVGDTLTLTGGCAGIALAHCSIDYGIHVPASVAISVHSEGGRVSVDRMHADVSLSSDSGRVSATNIKGSLTMTASSGRLSADSVVGDSVSLRADSGRISASGISARTFTAHADSGSIWAEFSSDPTTVTTAADSGSIDITVPPDNTDYDLTGVSAESGRVDINKIRARTGAPHKIIANASSGRISVGYPN